MLGGGWAHPVLSVLAVVDRLRGAYTWAPMDRPRRFGPGLPMDRESVARVSCLQADGRAWRPSGANHTKGGPKSRREIAERWIHHPRTGELGGGAHVPAFARGAWYRSRGICTHCTYVLGAASWSAHPSPMLSMLCLGCAGRASRRASEQQRRHVRCAIPRAQSWACARMRPTRSVTHPFPSR